jgi:hypothetical protein
VVWAAIRDTIVHVSLASGDVNKFKISDLADIGFADDLAALRPAQLGDAVFVNDMAVGPDGSAVISLNGAAQLILLTPQGAATTLPLPTGFQAGSVAVDRNGHLAALLQPVDAAAGARLIVADAADPARTARVTEPMAAVTVASRPEGGFLTGGYEARQRVDEAGNVQEGGVREVLYNVDAGMHRVGDSIVVVERDGLAVYPNEDAFLGGDEPARELISFGTFDCSANRPELAVPAPRPEDDRGDGPSRCPTTAMWVAVDGQNNLWTAHSGEPGLVYRLDGQRLP